MTMQKIWDLIREMTLEEKIGMIHGQGIFHTKGVERLGIPPLWMSDGPMGSSPPATWCWAQELWWRRPPIPKWWRKPWMNI